MSEKRCIYDAHHHLWALGQCRYPWLKAKGEKRFFGDPTPIQKDYLTKDFLEDASGFHVLGSTHIQVGVVEDDAIRETTWLQETADQATGVPSAIVGFADLTSNDIDEALAAHGRHDHFRGIRQIIGRHPIEDQKTKSGALLEDPRFLNGLRSLEREGLRFDLQMIEPQYQSAARLFSEVPELAIAICHFASPWDLSSDGFRRWRNAMAAFAALPCCYFKFSGFGMFKMHWTASDIAPYVETALTLFGENRCMAGSNFPVDKLYGDYGRIWRALETIINDANVLEKVTLTNAARFYGVDLAR